MAPHNLNCRPDMSNCWPDKISLHIYTTTHTHTFRLLNRHIEHHISSNCCTHLGKKGELFLKMARIFFQEKMYYYISRCFREKLQQVLK